MSIDSQKILSRAEQIRKDVENLRIEGNSMVHLTISGGFVACSSREFSRAEQIQEKAMELLLIARSMGKNQIRSLVDN